MTAVPASDLRVAGLDWAAQPPDRALVGVRFDRGTRAVVVESVRTRVSDDAVVEAVRNGQYASIGVDTPFGWPVDFVDFTHRWSCSEPRAGLSVPSYDAFAFRRTDLVVRSIKRPLSVSSDRIALATRTWVRLVADHGLQALVDVHAVRPATRPSLIEVYPGATLAALGTSEALVTDGYKKDAGVRSSLLDRLTTVFGLVLTPDHRTALVSRGKHAHAFDGLVAALAALMYEGVLGRPVRRPVSEAEQRDALREGWIMHAS